MVDSQATPSLSIHLTQDIPGGRYERSEDRGKSRTTMISPGAYERDESRLARRSARGDIEDRGEGYLSDEDPEKEVVVRDQRRERPISVSTVSVSR
jgi:hypothetical protein